VAQLLCDDLMLQLSNDKTMLTHARTAAARFLGYEITAHHDHSKGARGSRWTDGFMKLNVPRSVVKANTARHMRRGKPAHRSDLVNHDDHTIVATFGAEYRGLVQYYLLAGNVYWLNRVEWSMRTSMLRTLAAKHRSSVSKRPRSRRRTGYEPASKRRLRGQAEKHWSRGSVGYPSSGTGIRSPSIGRLIRLHTATGITAAL